REKELAPGPEILFVATGVTDGALMRGVRFFGGGLRTSSLIMSYGERLIRFADSVRLQEGVERAGGAGPARSRSERPPTPTVPARPPPPRGRAAAVRPGWGIDAGAQLMHSS